MEKLYQSANAYLARKIYRYQSARNGKVSIPENKIDMVSPRAIPILLLLSRELAISGYISGTGGSIGYTIVGKRVFDELR